MKPAFDQLAAEYESSSSVAIVDVDCTVHQDVCTKVFAHTARRTHELRSRGVQHGVSGYPTIKYWQDGEVKDYKCVPLNLYIPFLTVAPQPRPHIR